MIDRILIVVLCFGTLMAMAARVVYPTRGLDTFSWSASYEAVAHILWGCLVGIWMVEWARRVEVNRYYDLRHPLYVRTWANEYLLLWVVLLAWEVVFFFLK